MVVVGTAIVTVVALQPCRSTMCFDWATSTMAERSQPDVRGGIWFGGFVAIFLAPLWGLAAFAAGAWPVWRYERRRGT